MTDDKADQLEAQDEIVEIGIQTDPVFEVTCPGCGAAIDTHGITSFAEIACPNCRTRQTVPAMLGNFRLLRVLGSGGMGAVFLAQDDTLKRRVAIKVMLSSIGKNPELVATYRKEAQAAARLNHPNICQIYSFGEAKGQPYIVMELIGGEKFDDLIESGEPLEQGFVMRIGKEVVEGLAAAQAADLLHGDIKPANILLDDQLRAKLVDFGIASMLTSKDGNEEIWGTPFYIAPEKVQRRKADVRSDIYSLGATLYHALTGKPPFDGADEVAVIRARFEKPATPLAKLRPDLDPAVIAIVERMMQNDLFLRYPNYTSLLNDLNRYLDSLPAERKAGPSVKRRRLRASQAALSITGGATLTNNNSNSSPVPPPTTGGRRSFVIQRGTIAAAPTAVPSGPAPTPTGPHQPVEHKPNNTPKVIAVLVIVFFILTVLAGIGVLIGVTMHNQGKTREFDVMMAEAQAFEESLPEFSNRLAARIPPLTECDDEAAKVIASVSDVVRRALDLPLVIPNLEPVPQDITPPPLEETPAPAAPAAAEKAEAEDAPAAPTEEAAAADAGGDGGDGAAAEASDDFPAAAPDPAPEPAPVLAAPDNRPALVKSTDPLFALAKQIRTNLRRAEALRDREFAPMTVLKRETIDRAQWEERRKRVERREKDLAAIEQMVKESNAALLEMRRFVPGFERDAADLIAAARRQAEADRLAQEKAEAEKAKARAAEAAKAKIMEDVSYFNGVLSRQADAVRKYDYAKVAHELKRVRPDLGTPEGQQQLDDLVEQYERLESLRNFIIQDLHEHKGLRRGLGVGDVIDADKEAIHGVGDRRIPIEELTVGQWLNFIVKLLETRPAERNIRVIEHGEQLFNAAIFCIVHGGGQETAEAKALTLLNLALKRRTALRADVPRLLPAIAGREDD